MQTFEEWMVQNHPELIDENLRQNLGKLAIGMASFLPLANAQAAHPTSSKVASVESQNQQRLESMKRVSNVHRFKKNWGSEFSPQQDQKLFDFILGLKTEKDHNDFIEKVSKNLDEIKRVQSIGTDSKNFYKMYDYQYWDYVRALAYASKINL